MTLILALVVVALVAQGAALHEKEEFPAARNPSLWKQEEKALALVWCYQPFCWVRILGDSSLGERWEVLPEEVALVG